MISIEAHKVNDKLKDRVKSDELTVTPVRLRVNQWMSADESAEKVPAPPLAKKYSRDELPQDPLNQQYEKHNTTNQTAKKRTASTSKDKMTTGTPKTVIKVTNPKTFMPL